MGSKRVEGVTPKGDRIQLNFRHQKKRYRPTLDLPPTQANLKHAARRLEDIKHKIRVGTFDFTAEFPDYKFAHRLADTRAKLPTFAQVADLFLASCGGLEFATRTSYRKIIDHFWKPKLGEKRIDDIRPSELAATVGSHPWGSDKTRNNRVSVLRLVFDTAYRDGLIDKNPADRLKAVKVQKEPPDPYTVQDAEAVIQAMRDTYGEADANYVEFGFFTGCRPSELIALTWGDVDLKKGTVRVSKARVMGRDKNKTKTAVAGDIELYPRAAAVLTRQRQLTGLQGEHVFSDSKGKRLNNLQGPWKRWQFVHKKLTIRYREPYQMRHTSVTWNLMIGKNVLWVAEQHGHSTEVMLKTYAKWLKGSTKDDIGQIEAAMGTRAS